MSRANKRIIFTGPSAYLHYYGGFLLIIAGGTLPFWARWVTP